MAYGAYCQKAKEVAVGVAKLPEGVEVCTTLIHHKGDGVKQTGDDYGKDYVLPCNKAVRGMDMVITRSTGRCEIDGCSPKLPTSPVALEPKIVNSD